LNGRERIGFGVKQGFLGGNFPKFGREKPPKNLGGVWVKVKKRGGYSQGKGPKFWAKKNLGPKIYLGALRVP